MKRRESCVACEYMPVNFAGWWTFMPLFCCEAAPRKIVQRKRGKK